MRVSGDHGDIVLGWLTKLALVLGTFGLIGFDGISLMAAHFQAADHATAAAAAAAESYHNDHDVQKAFNAAYATVSGTDSIEPKTFHIASDGSVTLRLHREATTLLLQHIGPLRHFTDVVETGEGRPAA